MIAYRKSKRLDLTFPTPKDALEFRRLAHLDGCYDTETATVTKPDRFQTLLNAFPGVLVEEL